MSTALITSNAAITNKAAEIELQYNPIEQLTIRFGLGYVDARYDDNQYSETVNYQGNKVKMIPEWDSSLASTYQWSNGLYIRRQWRLLGKTALTVDNKVFRLSTVLYDFSAGYKGNNWQVRLFVENITNKCYEAGQADENFMLGFDTNYYGPISSPRIIGLELNYAI